MVWSKTIPSSLASSGGLGVFSVPAPAARPAAYTLTGAASRVEAAQASAAVAATGSTAAAPFGYTTAAQADAIVAAVNNLVGDVGTLHSVLRQVIADLQATGLLQ